MKHLLLFNLLLLFFGTAQAQEVVIDGVTFSADLKTLIKYPADKVNEEYVIPEGTEMIDTIAFSYNDYLHKVTIPSTLKEIVSHAFVECKQLTDIVWGTYPDSVGQDIFWEIPTTNFSVTPYNHDCKIIKGLLYSVDGKRLLKAPVISIKGEDDGNYYRIPEGTEIISKGAFELSRIEWFAFPSSLKKIEDFAFWICIIVHTGSVSDNPLGFGQMEYRYPSEIQCNALTPPEIIGNPFALPQEIHLNVPEESFGVYCDAPVWGSFGYINGVRDASIGKTVSADTQVKIVNETLTVVSEKKIARIKLFNQEGKLLFNETVGSNFYYSKLNDTLKGVLLLETVYDNSMSQVFKLYK